MILLQYPMQFTGGISRYDILNQEYQITSLISSNSFKIELDLMQV